MNRSQRNCKMAQVTLAGLHDFADGMGIDRRELGFCQQKK